MYKRQVYDAFGHPVQKQHLTADWDIGAAEKGGYPHFMLKEIHEQPEALRATVNPVSYTHLRHETWAVPRPSRPGR